MEESFKSSGAGWALRLRMTQDEEELAVGEGIGSSKKQAQKEATLAMLHAVIELRLK
jgi:dsRNA-specific ribonuclease